jgi:hypothetical protein
MPVIDSEEIAFRCDLGLLCGSRGYKAIVEVGVDRGLFSKRLIDRFPGHLIGVDPYNSWPDGDEQGLDTRQPDYMQAVLATQQWSDRVRFFRERSPDIIAKLPQHILDDIGCVYIDGKHDRASVEADIRGWWDVLPDDGMLAGHDYDQTHPDVVDAVNDFSDRTGAVVRIVRGDPEQSWYAYKSEPAELHRHYFLTGDIPNPFKS